MNLKPAPEDFHAEPVLVADFLEGVQEAHQVDDSLAGHEPFVVQNLFRGQIGRIVEVHMHDAAFAGVRRCRRWWRRRDASARNRAAVPR